MSMASASELRAKLLAKRAAQQDEIKRKEDIHEQAKAATKQRVFLGYNFDDILKLSDSGVGEEHLNLLFRSVGIYRKRKSAKELKKNAFGASRWLDKREEFIINFDEEISTSESESETEEVSASNFKRLKPDTEAGANSSLADGLPSENGTRSLGIQEAPWDVSNSLVNTTTESLHTAPEEFLSSHPNEPDVEMIEEENLLDCSEDDSHIPSDESDFSPAKEEYESHMESPAKQVEYGYVPAEQIASEHASPEYLASEHDDLHTDLHTIPQPEHIVSEHPVQQHTEPETTLPELDNSLSESSPEDVDMMAGEDANEDAVHEELEKIKAQIAEMQQRKLERNAQRTMEQTLARQNMKLRDIASRRALLSQKRERIDVNKAATRVAQLEKKLVTAKGQLQTINQQLKGIELESLELEKQEGLLREELSRPRIVTAESAQIVDGEDDFDRGNAEELEAELRFAPLTVQDSPLRAFSSFRMCPSFGPSQWFSRSFNGHFVNNLASRSFCATEFNGKKGKCRDPGCEDVHYAEFDIDPLKVCQYMATRQIDRPGFRTKLIEAMGTYLTGDNVSADQLAASIIGFCRKYDSSQILDWEGWEVKRPL